MKVLGRASNWLLILVLCGCASSNITAYQPYQGKIDRPDRIIVYDFAATPSELPPEVAIAGQGAAPLPLTAAQFATGRRVVTVATANPLGLVVSVASKAYGEASGSETIEGAAERTAHEIAVKIRATAERQGWI
jgi:hypothetical protein